MTRFSPFRLLSPAGSGARLSIFIFHRVLDRPDPLRPDEPDRDRFERIVRFLTKRFRVLALAEAAMALERGTLPAAAACITFDDGYADNLNVAAPILCRHGATATLFVATAYVNGGRMWNDTVIEAVRALPAGEVDWREFGLGTDVVSDAASRQLLVARTLQRLRYFDSAERATVADEIGRRAGLDPAQSELMLTTQQLRNWRSLGLDVGGHTMNHPILARLDETDASREISAGREELARWLGEAPRTFAYPNGVPGRDYGPRDVALVRRAGYACAVSTLHGAAGRGADIYQLPRFTPWDRSMWRFGLRCAHNLVSSQGRRGQSTQEVRS